MSSGYPDNPGSYPYGPPPQPAGGYGYGPQPDPPYPPAYPQRRSGMAIAALVLGILAVLLCWTVFGGIVLGLVAVILGAVAYRRARRGQGGGRGMALGGLITGAIGVLLAGGLVAIGISLLNSPTGQSLRTCLENANGDQAATAQCYQQLQNQGTR